MSTICDKCKGVIPDVMFGNEIDRYDCKNHKKIETDVNYTKKTLAEKNREKCKVRMEKGDMWCADDCPDTYTCPYSAK